MIKSVLFKKDFRCFLKGDKFDFRSDINVLVGDQGSGKSTLLELIRSKLETKKIADNDSSYRAKSILIHNKIDDLIEIDMDANTKCFAYDFERESARDMSAIHFDMVNEQIMAMRSSHGQGNFISLTRVLGNLSKSRDKIDLVMLDEPDAAMSPRSCYTLLLILQALKNKWNKQIIVSAHNPILIKGFHPLLKKEFQSIWSEVLSLEDKAWMSSSEFMALQLTESRSINEKKK